jgi:hypothetical protein
MDDAGKPIPTVATPAEMAQIIEGTAAVRIGIVAAAARRAELFDALVDLLSRPGRHVWRFSTGQVAEDLERRLADQAPPAAKPAAPSLAPTEWRERILAGLLEEQNQAQQRLATVKEQGQPADAVDREVAGWLAAGLRDFLADPITSASFLVAGKGSISRIAAGDATARFTESDFLRPDGIRFMEASRPAQTMLTKLSLASTNQFRVAAARLLNRILDRLATPVLTEDEPLPNRLATHLRERKEEIIVLCVEPCAWMSLNRFVDFPEAPIRFVATADDESAFQSQERFAIYRLAEPKAPAPTVPDWRPELIAKYERLAQSFQREAATVALLSEHQVVRQDELPELIDVERRLAMLSPIEMAGDGERESLATKLGEIEPVLAALHQALCSAWQAWFARQLAGLDAEGMLQHMMAIENGESPFVEALSGRESALQALHEAWANGQRVATATPRSAAEWTVAEEVVASLERLNQQTKEHLAREDEGTAFDAAVAAGGAPMDQLTEAVIWWLKQENRDWEKYRIVRIE